MRHYTGLMLVLWLGGLVNGSCHQPTDTLTDYELIRVDLPVVETKILTAYAQMDFPAISESSGLVRGVRDDSVYWTHNDSGDDARIFAVRREGGIVQPQGMVNYGGIAIDGAQNIDWEDIDRTDDGNLVIGACGNNANMRRDLAVYIVPEPFPESQLQVTALEKYDFRFPDQSGYPSGKMNFDCEAVFTVGGKFYFLTKHRSDSNTKLYRMDDPVAGEMNTLTLLNGFAIHGQVTAANAIRVNDRYRLVVLTYEAVWVFETRALDDDFFYGKIWWSPIFANQCEGICFDDPETILISNEQRDLFEVKLEELTVVRE